VGYDVTLLIDQIEQVLGLTHRRAVALVGVGNLGHALAGYAGFGNRGFRIAALFDADLGRVGERINGLVVQHIEDLATAAGVNSAKLRKDLSHLGRTGTRGVGYDVSVLIEQIEHVLGLTQRRGVALSRLEGSLLVTIADNGVGGAHLAKGHGLTGLADRVQAAGGVLDVESADGAGTTVVAALPL
jgi:NADH/NAD ratio-sensing transcriptional regulator Rex